MIMNIPLFMSNGSIPFMVRVEESKLAHDGMAAEVERAAVYVKGRHWVVVNYRTVDVKGVSSCTDTVGAVPPYGALVNSHIECRLEVRG